MHFSSQSVVPAAPDTLQDLKTPLAVHAGERRTIGNHQLLRLDRIVVHAQCAAPDRAENKASARSHARSHTYPRGHVGQPWEIGRQAEGELSLAHSHGILSMPASEA